MSWQCTSWALREAPAPTSTARLVLIALADRCQPDGRSAWPTVETLAQEAHTSKASVKRALKALEECGAIRRGNQLLAQWDEHGQYVPEPYRPIVWECCMNVTLEHVVEKPGRQARLEREQRLGTTEENRGVKMTPLENIGNKPIVRGVKMSPLTGSDPVRGVTSDTSRGSTSDTSIRETNKKQIIPSAPTGHLPASGETPTENEKDGKDELTMRQARFWIDPNAGPELWDDLPVTSAGAVGLVFRALEAGWAKPPLMPVPKAVSRRFKRERTTAQRLIVRHGLETVVKVALWAASPTVPDSGSVSGGRSYDGFWRRTLTGVRSLESHWDQVVAQMADDQAGRATLREIGLLDAVEPVDSLPTKRDTSMKPSSSPSYGIPDLVDRRVASLLEGRIPVECDGLQTHIRLRCLLKTHPDISSAELAGLVDQAISYGRDRWMQSREYEQRQQAEREERSRRAEAAIAAYRQANGGSCFIGSVRKAGVSS